MGLREAYNAAISETMICATAAICMSILATFGMRWFNLKRLPKKRDGDENEQITQPAMSAEKQIPALKA